MVGYSLQEEPPVCAGEPVTIAKRVHPFPSRTRKLSFSAPMILWGQPHGKIGSRRLTRPHRWFFFIHALLILLKTRATSSTTSSHNLFPNSALAWVGSPITPVAV